MLRNSGFFLGLIRPVIVVLQQNFQQSQETPVSRGRYYALAASEGNQHIP